MNRLYLMSSILRQTTTKCNDNKYKQKTYKVIRETNFKKHYANDKKLFNLIKSKNDTKVSTEYWTLKEKQQASGLTWEINGRYNAYNTNFKKCNLCFNEKLAIIDYPDKKILNLVRSNLPVPPPKKV